MTTVGWGDTSPVTVTGKVLTVFYILEGLTLLVSLLGTVFEYAVAKAQKAGETTKDKLQDLTEATLGNDAVDTPRVYANAVTEFFKCNWLKLSPRVRAFVSSHAPCAGMLSVRYVSKAVHSMRTECVPGAVLLCTPH
jgi:Ion channel